MPLNSFARVKLGRLSWHDLSGGLWVKENLGEEFLIIWKGYMLMLIWRLNIVINIYLLLCFAPIKLGQLPRRDLAEESCGSKENSNKDISVDKKGNFVTKLKFCLRGPTTVTWPGFLGIRDGWRLQNGWIFGKVPRGGGIIFNPNFFIVEFGPLNRVICAEIEKL